MAQQNQAKNYLFYSNHCQHSKRLLDRITKSAILQSLQLINIDDQRIALPPFVQCVPTLYLSGARQVLTDSHLFDWFNAQIQQDVKNSGTVNMADVTGDASILPFHQSEMTSGLSGASYSFLDDDKNDLINQNYSFLQDRDINKLPEFTRYDAQPPQSQSGGGMGGGGNSQANPGRRTGGTVDKAYENLMAARSMDTPQKLPPPTPNFSLQ